MRGSLENPLHRRGGAQRQRSRSAGVGSFLFHHPSQGLTALGPPRWAIFSLYVAPQRAIKNSSANLSLTKQSCLLIFAWNGLTAGSRWFATSKAADLKEQDYSL